MSTGIYYEGFCYTDEIKFIHHFLNDQSNIIPYFKQSDSTLQYITQYPSTPVTVCPDNSQYTAKTCTIFIDKASTPYLTDPSYNIKYYLSFQNSNPSLNVYQVPRSKKLSICDTNFFGPEPVNLNVTYPPDTFNPSNINPVDAANSIGSGFLLIAVPLAVAWAGRQFLKPLFSKI